MDYPAYVLGMFFSYWLAACACFICWRMYGKPILNAAAVMGLGGYLVAILLSSGLSYLLIPIVVVAVVVIGSSIGLVLRSADDEEMVVLSVIVQFVLLTVFRNWDGVTGGPMGRSVGTAGESIFILAGGGALICMIGISLIWSGARTMFGSAVVAVGANSRLLSNLGHNSPMLRLLVLTTVFGMLIIAGGVHGVLVGFVHPDNYSLSESLIVLSMAVFGGRGGVFWSMLGASLVIGIPEMLRFLDLDASTIGKLRAIIMGGVLVVAALVFARSKQR